MTNHPNRSNLAYPVPAPVFADADLEAEIIGQARTAAEAMALYEQQYVGTGMRPTKAVRNAAA
jgi:hypothetical protein